MANEKSLKIGVNFNDKSSKSVSSSLKDIKKGGEDLNKSFTGLNKTLKDIGKNFANISNEMKSFKKTLEDIQRLLSSSNSGFSKIAATLQGAGNGGGRGVVGGGGGSSGGGGSRGGAGGGNVNNNGGMLVPLPGGGYTVAPNGNGGGLFSPNNQLTRSLNTQRVIADTVASGIRAGLGFFQEIKNAPASNMAAVAGFHGTMLRRLANGDFYDMAVLNRGRGNGVNGVSAAGGTGLMTADQFVNGITDPIKGMASGASIGGEGGALVGGGLGVLTASGKAIKSEATGGKQAAAAEALRTQLESGRQINPYQQMLFENLAATAGIRLRGARRLGNRAGFVSGLGAGYGLNMSDAIGFGTSIADQFGENAVLGTRPGLGIKVLDPRTGKRLDQGGSGMGLMQHALQLETFGLDRENASNVIGTMGRANGMNTGSARRTLEEIFAKGVERGLRSVKFFDEIGRAVADATFGQGGRSLGTKYGQLLSAGFGAEATPQDIQTRAGGFAAYGNIFQSNGFLRANALERAKQLLGPGATTLQMEALASASPQELVNGNSSELNTLFPDEGKRRQLTSRMFTGGLQELFAKTVSNRTPEGQELISGLSANGGDVTALMKNGRYRDLFSSILNRSVNGFGGFDQINQLLAAVSGFGDSGANADDFAKGMGRRGDKMAFNQLRTQAQIQQQMVADESSPENVKAFMDAFKSGIEGFKTLKEIQPGFEAAENTMKALQDLVKTIQSDPGTVNKIRDITLKVERQKKAK